MNASSPSRRPNQSSNGRDSTSKMMLRPHCSLLLSSHLPTLGTFQILTDQPWELGDGLNFSTVFHHSAILPKTVSFKLLIGSCHCQASHYILTKVGTSCKVCKALRVWLPTSFSNPLLPIHLFVTRPVLSFEHVCPPPILGCVSF